MIADVFGMRFHLQRCKWLVAQAGHCQTINQQGLPIPYVTR